MNNMNDKEALESSFKVPEPLLQVKQSSCSKNFNEQTPLEKSITCEKNVKEPDANKNKSISKASIKINVPLPYDEPNWSGFPPQNYSFEVIKNGTSVAVVDIKTPNIVFGRLDVCNVILEHPSVSRYHAIVQYCKGDDTHPKGFYLYDLNSTHGTFLNKEKVKPNIYYKLKVGYIVKFGGSTRLHIFQGPDEEEEVLTIKETKDPIKSEVDECNWGLGEDAEEEDDLSENPFALSTPNENLYIDDPKKTLRGWFEREGYELEYDVEEKGFKSFSCRVQLPIDNPTGDFVTVEATVSGKKKEAVIACALDACRTLDRYGILRQSHQESRQQKKKKWEDDDFYDSDEDTYLDRTGTIEKKREIRKNIEKKSNVETFQSLEIKFKAVSEEITEIEKKLSAATAIVNVQVACDTEEDSLEAYMSSIKDTAKAPSDKLEKTKLKFRLTALEKEKRNLEKLLEIARPTKLPPIVKYPGMVGKRLKSKLNLPKEKLIPKPKKFQVKTENVEENESDSEKEGDKSIEDDVKSLETISDDKSIEDDVDSRETISDDKSKYGLQLKLTENKQIKRRKPNDHLDIKSTENTDTELKVDQTEQKTERKIGPNMPVEIIEKKRHVKKAKKDADVYSTNTSEYSTWVPPVGQSGDGKTHLNAKFGY